MAQFLAMASLVKDLVSSYRFSTSWPGDTCPKLKLRIHHLCMVGLAIYVWLSTCFWCNNACWIDVSHSHIAAKNGGSALGFRYSWQKYVVPLAEARACGFTSTCTFPCALPFCDKVGWQPFSCCNCDFGNMHMWTLGSFFARLYISPSSLVNYLW